MQPEALDRCPWLCAAPQGPDTPFDWPVFFIVDSLRLIITAGAVVLILLTAWAIRRSQVRGQKLRFLSVVPLLISTLGTELTHLGDVPHWRFAVNLAGVAIMAWGYWEHLHCELPARHKPEPKGQDLPP
jgi:branched-subunit amino acid ABC-type transport system permease component